MIKGTNADCKIINISVSETTATITLLIFATVSTNPAKSFAFYVQDEGSQEKKQLNNYTYWIDRYINYDFNANNIDTNKNKEVILNIDITNGNTANISDKHWTRNCYIQLCDTSKTFNNVAWSSDKLSLVSDEFEIPTVKNIKMIPSVTAYDLQKEKDIAKIGVSFELDFNSEKDFNYNNKNFLATLNIRSLATDLILETKQVAKSTNKLNEVETDNFYEFNEKIVIEILITDNKGNLFSKTRKIFSPRKKYSKSTFIKTDTGIKEVRAFYINTDSSEEHEGEWLK